MDLSALTGPVLDNTIAALIGAFIISGLAWGYRRTKDEIAQRKYSINGEYRTYYEDTLDDGSISLEKGTLRIKQKGLKLHAEEYDESMDKDWIFDGEIDPSTGHVYGHFKTKSAHESGLGVCIFEQKKNGILDGVWAGYDESVNVIEQGRYTLVKRLDINIRKATHKDSVTVLHLLDQELGEDWIYLEDIDRAIDDDYLYVADYDGKIIGFTLLRMLDFKAFEKELKGHEYKIPRDIEIAAKHDALGFIEAIATDPAFQKRGIGSKLIQKSLDVLQARGAEMVCALGWKTEKVHIEPAMNIFEFSKRHEFEKFWYEESIEKNEKCHYCGLPCTCGSVLFTKVMNHKFKSR